VLLLVLPPALFLMVPAVSLPVLPPIQPLARSRRGLVYCSLPGAGRHLPLRHWQPGAGPLEWAEPWTAQVHR